MCRAVLVRTLAAASALAWGCDPVVDARYGGEPLLTIRGQLAQLDLASSPASGEVRVALFWSPTRDAAAPIDLLVEQPRLVFETKWPVFFTIHVFEPPPAAALPADGGYGVAAVLVYDDRDRDGRYAPGDALLGGAQQHAVVWAPQPLTSEASPTALPLEAGLHVLPVPMFCAPTELPAPVSEVCGVALGSACESAADCGTGGTCLSELVGQALSGGYCSVSDPACTAQAGVLLESGAGVSWALRGCKSDADCPRAAGGYTCQADLGGACWLPWPLFLELAPEFQVAPTCSPLVTRAR